MIRFTAPQIDLTVEGRDLSDFDVYVTIEQGNKKITKSGADLYIETETHGQVTDTNISFLLSQEETALFAENRNAEIQVNWIDDEGLRKATEIQTITIKRNLLNEVIE